MGTKICWKRLICILSIGMIVLFLIGTVMAAFYSVNQSDDYAHAVTIGVYQADVWQYFVTSVGYMISQYHNWAGNYFSMFLQSLLSPINGFGTPQLRLVMVINAIFFFVTFIAVLYCFTSKVFSIELHYKLVIITAIVYALMNYKCYQEIFYWFSGAISYSFPLIVMYMSMLALLLEKRRKSRIIIASVLGFLAVGGSLTMAGAGCFIMLLVCLYDFLCNKRIPMKHTLVFGAYLIGSVINVVAPGNYVRAEGGISGEGLLKAFKNVFIAAYSEYRELFHDTNFIVVLIIIVICGMLIYHSKAREVFADHVNAKNYVIVSAIAMLTPMIAIFPVVLGYDSKFIANRTQFIIDQSIIVTLVNAAFLFGCYIGSIIDTNQIRIFIILLGIMSACFIAQCDYSIKQHQSIKTLLLATNGSYREYHNECESLNMYFESKRGEDVIVTEDMMPSTPENFSYFYLENGWVNDFISRYYGLNSLTYEYEE